MVTPQACKGLTNEGTKCGAPPLRDAEFCFWHDPEHATEAGEARRLGGLRRKKERTRAQLEDIHESLLSYVEPFALPEPGWRRCARWRSGRGSSGDLCGAFCRG